MTKSSVHNPPTIDPRRIHNPIAEGEYGGPPAALSKSVSPPTSPMACGDRRGLAAAAPPTAPAPVRYEGALREFSSKLPERSAVYKTPYLRSASGASGVPPTTTALLRFYQPPPGAMIGVQHSHSASHTNLSTSAEPTAWRYSGPSRSFHQGGDENRFRHSATGGNAGRTMTELIKCMPAWSQGVQHSFTRGDVDKFREPTRSLRRIEANGYAHKMLDAVPYDALDDPTVAAMVEVQDESWDCFVDGDKYMDEVKKYNASNVVALKEQRNRSRDDEVIKRYEGQLRACVADPDGFTATWDLLGMLCSDKLALLEYITSDTFLASLTAAERSNVVKLIALERAGFESAAQSSASDANAISIGVDTLTLSDGEEAIASSAGEVTDDTADEELVVEEKAEVDTIESLSVDGTAGSGSVSDVEAEPGDESSENSLLFTTEDDDEDEAVAVQ